MFEEFLVFFSFCAFLVSFIYAYVHLSITSVFFIFTCVNIYNIFNQKIVMKKKKNISMTAFFDRKRKKLSTSQVFFPSDVCLLRSFDFSRTCFMCVDVCSLFHFALLVFDRRFPTVVQKNKNSRWKPPKKENNNTLNWTLYTNIVYGATQSDTDGWCMN